MDFDEFYEEIGNVLLKLNLVLNADSNIAPVEERENIPLVRTLTLFLKNKTFSVPEVDYIVKAAKTYPPETKSQSNIRQTIVHGAFDLPRKHFQCNLADGDMYDIERDGSNKANKNNLARHLTILSEVLSYSSRTTACICNFTLTDKDIFDFEDEREAYEDPRVVLNLCKSASQRISDLVGKVQDREIDKESNVDAVREKTRKQLAGLDTEYLGGEILQNFDSSTWRDLPKSK